MGVETISENGIKLIKSFEGCRLKAYKAVPTEKLWTIGWGHYGVSASTTWTQKQADDQFLIDIQKYVNYVKKYAPKDLNQNEFDALVSFTYNCGAGNLQTLCKNRNKVQIGNALLAYNKSGGRILEGLNRRRQAEKALYFIKIEILNWNLVFNPTYYSNRYPDLKANGLVTKDQLFNHFKSFGMKECRQGCSSFSVTAYKNNYKDLQEAFGDNMPEYYYHYMRNGHSENRKTI